ncbi:MAG: hypothetical protein QM708_12925 [Propioniciclava sp.]|uniref:hypothetical protein n=1 Tax=Propioniciclava sp. TaxID=2038686 RepID=UPI0039E64F7F
MATTHTVTTPRDLAMAQTYVAYRNEVLWPTRKLQRVLMAACVVAAGFVFTPGTLRYALWAVAGLILVWTFLGDQVTARVRAARARGGDLSYAFSTQGFRDATSAGGWHDYGQIVALYSTDAHWVLRLRIGAVAILARDGVDGGAMTPAGFEQFLTTKTKLRPEPLKKSVSAKVKQTQEARRGYLEENPGLIARTLRQRAPRTPDAQDS